MQKEEEEQQSMQQHSTTLSATAAADHATALNATAAADHATGAAAVNATELNSTQRNNDHTPSHKPTSSYNQPINWVTKSQGHTHSQSYLVLCQFVDKQRVVFGAVERMQCCALLSNDATLSDSIVADA